MSYLYLSHAKPASPHRSVPWLLFAFVSCALFVIFHWPLEIRADVEDYGDGQEIVFAGLQGSMPRQVMLVSLCVVSIAGLIRRRKDSPLGMNGVLAWILVSFVAWATLSLLWAQDRSLTATRLASYLILCIFAVSAASRLPLRQFVLFVFSLTSLYLAVAVSSEFYYGLFKPLVPGYRFSGIQHPNAEAIECALLAFSGFVAGNTEKRWRWLYRTFALAGFLFLVLTASRTTLAGAVLAFVAYGLATSKRKTRTMLLPLTGVVASIVIVLALAGSFQGVWGKLFPGRDDAGGGNVESLAGRSRVWEDVFPYMQEHPVTGYGFGGFWTKNIQLVVSEEEGWEIPDGHSTYVDCILTLGGVGLGLYVLYLGMGLWRAFEAFGRTRDPHFAFLAGILIFCLVDGSLESSAGEVSLLACLSGIALVRLAFLPIVYQPEIAARSLPTQAALCEA